MPVQRSARVQSSVYYLQQRRVKGTNHEGSRCNTPLWPISAVHNPNSAAVSKQPSRVKVIKWWCTPQWRHKRTLTRPLAGFPIGTHISFMSGTGILLFNSRWYVPICVWHVFVCVYIQNCAVLGLFLYIFLVVFHSFFHLFLSTFLTPLLFPSFSCSFSLPYFLSPHLLPRNYILLGRLSCNICKQT